MTGTEVDAEVRRTPDRAILGVIFLLLFVMAYSEEIVCGAFQILDRGAAAAAAGTGGGVQLLPAHPS